ncbi:LysR family transcriptional regulator [Lentzea sp. BCCO 10_0856]|uniref:LysR family transcriptional regulator n=1 Tax=Lentzea miocenica TaxID=3095431 RepID=A0ABU4SXD7_9PSEU|nr:LysR family transcriptional regulator [Lentzea sp. BCCO 10_0856]MDX8030566.1 LysR family transcriptional regulator [Lentzea sp. BCCO 10_0856]
MDIRQLRYFLAVVDHGSVNKAAAALHVAQPSLSQAIRALERDLGLDLLCACSPPHGRASTRWRACGSDASRSRPCRRSPSSRSPG